MIADAISSILGKTWILALLAGSFAAHVGFVFLNEDLHSVQVFCLIAGLVGWCSTALLVTCCARWFHTERLRYWAVYFVGAGWYTVTAHSVPEPVFLALSLFWIGFCLLVLDIQRRVDGIEIHAGSSLYLLAGLVFGTALRAELSLWIVELVLLVWVLRYGRLTMSELISLLLGVAIAIGLGVFASYFGGSLWISVSGLSGRMFNTAPQALRQVMQTVHWVTALGLAVVVIAALKLKRRLSLTWVVAGLALWWKLRGAQADLLLGIFPALAPMALLLVQVRDWSPSRVVLAGLGILNLAALGLSFLVPYYF